MKKRHVIVTVAAGMALGFGACKSGAPTTNPPAPVENPPPPEPDPVPEPVPETVPEVTLPSWDEVASGHPEGATNPPHPQLIVTPEGDCYKKWVGGMIGPRGDQVQACDADADCGTQVVCPERAAALLEHHQAGDTEPTGPK